MLPSVSLSADGQYQEFLDPLIEMVKSFQKPKASQPKQWDIIQLLQDAERSNCIVVVSPPYPITPIIQADG
jgi:hypothetical protein